MNNKQITGIVLFIIGLLLIGLILETPNSPDPNRTDIIYSIVACIITLGGILLCFCGKKKPINTPHILIIYDEPNTILVISDRLTLNDFRVSTAATTEEGVRKIKANMPDIIIAGHFTSGEEEKGFIEFTRLMKKLGEKTNDIPVIVLMTEPISAACLREKDIFMFKPFDLSDLLTEIETLLTI